MPTQIMLVDDHAVVRMGFKMLLESDPSLKVMAEAGDAETALAHLNQPGATLPDILVADISMPGMDGLGLVERIKARHGAIKVLVMSAHDETTFIRRAMAAGAQGYLCKRAAPERLLDAVRRLAGGGRYLQAELAEKLALEDLDGGDPVASLTPREFEVFLHLAKGKAAAQIAKQLFLSPGTVGTHLYHIKQKLGADNAAELSLLAMQRGLISP